MPTLDEILAGSHLPETTIRLCLDGALASQLDDAERALAAAQRVVTTSLTGTTAVADATALVTEIRARIQESAVTFRLRGVTPRRWSDLVTENPPRVDNAGDRALGYNPDRLFPDLVAASLIEPEVRDRAHIDALMDAVSAGQWDTLVDAALTVSRRKVDIPFSLPASPPTEASD